MATHWHDVIMAKFPGVQGITLQGDFIREWPESLGPKPTPEQIAQWTREHVPIPEPPEFHWLLASDEERLEKIRQMLDIQD